MEAPYRLDFHPAFRASRLHRSRAGPGQFDTKWEAWIQGGTLDKRVDPDGPSWVPADPQRGSTFAGVVRVQVRSLSMDRASVVAFGVTTAILAHADWGLMPAPAGYEPAGEPKPQVIAARGATGPTITGEWGRIEFEVEAPSIVVSTYRLESAVYTLQARSPLPPSLVTSRPVLSTSGSRTHVQFVGIRVSRSSFIRLSAALDERGFLPIWGGYLTETNAPPGVPSTFTTSGPDSAWSSSPRGQSRVSHVIVAEGRGTCPRAGVMSLVGCFEPPASWPLPRRFAWDTHARDPPAGGRRRTHRSRARSLAPSNPCVPHQTSRPTLGEIAPGVRPGERLRT